LSEFLCIKLYTYIFKGTHYFMFVFGDDHVIRYMGTNVVSGEVGDA